MLIVKTLQKDFNISRVHEELSALPIASVTWAGFVRSDERIYAPAAARQRVGYSSANGEDFADPGEVRILTTRALTGPEADSLDTLLAAHDHNVLTAEQVRQDQDASDIDEILATERAAFIAALQTMQNVIDGWDSASTANKLIGAKSFFVAVHASHVTIGKVLRVFLRRERGSAI